MRDNNDDNNAMRYAAAIAEALLLLLRYRWDIFEFFYNTWKLYNVVKKPNNNLIIETEKTKLFAKLISNNSIFKRIYLDKVEEYNLQVAKLKCNLPILPTEYKTRYEVDEVKYPKKESADVSFFKFGL